MSLTTLAASARTNSPFLNNRLSFTENKGQVKDQFKNPRNDIQFSLQGQGVNVFVGDGQLHYQWSKTLATREITIGGRMSREATEAQMYRMDVELVGADRNAKVVISEKQNDYDAFYHSSVEPGKIANKYNRITYKNVYPNIDWVLYSSDNQFKYDFVVRSGGNVNDIRLKFHGATSLKLKDGQLVAETPMGSITEDAPYSYDATSKERVASKFVLDGNELTFYVASASNVVIDPAVMWSTYIGGNGNEAINDVAFDAGNNSYVLGGTSSASNIATIGAFQTTLMGPDDACILKFNSMGQRQWGSYYECRSLIRIAIDKNGDIIVAGTGDTSCHLGTVGTHKPVADTSIFGDVFILKTNSLGQPIWGTFYGGFVEDVTYCMTIDTAGNVIVGGRTENYINIATPGAYQTTPTAPYSGFLAKFDHTGQLLWGTYVGSSSPGYAHVFDIGTDLAGNIYTTGETHTTGLATTGIFQENFSADGDGIIYKFSPTGQRLWTTYYGHTAEDYLGDIAVEPSGTFYVSGTSRANNNNSNYHATPGTFTQDFKGRHLSKFSSNGQRIWGTYFGSTNVYKAAATRIRFSPATNKIYISGENDDTATITTTGSYQPTRSGGSDAYYMVFDTAGRRTYGTYLGGAAIESASGISVDNAGSAYLYGYTRSTAGIATSGAHQTTLMGTEDGFLAKFAPDSVVSVKELSPGSLNMKVFPNPTTGVLNLKANVKTSVMIDVLSITGQVVYQTTAVPQNGKVNRAIMLDSKLPNGTYLLRMTTNKETQTLRFIMQR